MVSLAWAKGSSKRWRRIRAYVLARDLGRCQIAIQGTWTVRDGSVRQCMGTADCVHHTHGRGVTGDDVRYLVAACTPCNLKIGDPGKSGDPAPKLETWFFPQ